MIITTTPVIEGHPTRKYLGIVTGEVIIGANLFKDLTARIHDILGGRASSYERTLREAKDEALREMEERAQRLGGNAVVGVDIDYETLGRESGMLMVSVSGTAVMVD